MAFLDIVISVGSIEQVLSIVTSSIVIWGTIKVRNKQGKEKPESSAKDK